MAAMFMARLSYPFRVKLEHARSGKVLGTFTGAKELSWEDIVQVAKDALYSVRVLTDEELARGAPAPVATPATAPAATPAAPARGAPAQGGGTAGGWQREKCSLCTTLGTGLDMHSRAQCFIDPASKVFKPEIRQRRLQAVVAKGGTIPQWVTDV